MTSGADERDERDDDLDADDLCLRLVSDRLRARTSAEVAELNVAAARRDLAEHEALETSGRPVRVDRAERFRAGSSIVFTLRLGHEEYDALERRAVALEMPPSTLARNLLRRALRRHALPDYSELIEDLERTTARLRALAR